MTQLERIRRAPIEHDSPQPRAEKGKRRWTGDLRLLPSVVVGWGAAVVAIRGDALLVTAAALLAAGIGLILACVIFLVPAGAENWFSRRLSPALAPAAALTLVLLTTGGSLASMEAGPVDEATRTSAHLTAVLRVTGEPSSLGPGAFGGEDLYLVDAVVVGGVLRSKTFASATPVVVIGSEEWAGVGAGDVVRVLGSVEPPERVGRARAVFLPSGSATIQHAEGWLGYTDGVRSRFREASLMDQRDGGLLPGMALGDRIPLDPELEEDMRTTGLTHLTAVSGANCSYVVAFAFLGLRLVRCPRLLASAGAVVALAAFVLLVRPEPSVLRAAVMGSIGVVAVLSGRGKVSLTLLMLSVVVLLAVDPWLSVSFAFILSVAATLGLVIAGPLVVRVLCTLMPRLLAQLLAIPFTAQLFCTPVLVLIQPSLPAYSLPANVLASPVVPAVTLLGMTAVLALVGAPVLALPLVTLAQWGTRWVAQVATALADAPAAALPWPAGAPGALLAAFCALVILLVLVRRDEQDLPVDQQPLLTRALTALRVRGAGRSGRREAGQPRRTRSRTGLFLGVGVFMVVVLVLSFVLLHRSNAAPRSTWLFALCDVGQGDGIVVRTTPGHALVVDAGPDPDAMDRCLDALRIDVVDAVVITHLHEDHYGGVEGVVRERGVNAVYYSSGEESAPREVTEAADTAGVEPQRLDSGTTISLPPVDVDVLWPTRGAPLGEENNASAVLRVVVPTEARPVSLLLTGDLEEDAAVTLLSASPALTEGMDVLKVAHHGARNGGRALLDAVDPSLAVISVGRDNDYGHPHPSIIEALTSSEVATARTDELGSFTVDIIKDTLEVRPFG